MYCWRNITLIKWLTGSFKPLPMKVNWNRENGDKWDLVNICSRIEVTVKWKCTVVHLAGALVEFFIHFNDLVVATPCFTSRSTGSYTPVNIPTFPLAWPLEIWYLCSSLLLITQSEHAKPNSIQDFDHDWSRSTPISCLFNFLPKIGWHVTDKQMQICRFCFIEYGK